ncbi:hypothetical protein [Acidianus bottle-shaped virus 3 strain ABV3]|uniref:Uncharacterized protein n=1 Tax=Acidianus bottle-shaped virus 3 strain ABV3 TaxID=1732174 RepID=A0A0N9P977_9VIRU|nr:hypothetical protein AVU00_gp11 [Acidianus bottle-shaped virus 3 strain ABV3]ALG96813.1 hypothetical protein [Acidianus bottle-shaped virus 3 strain ABV3]
MKEVVISSYDQFLREIEKANEKGYDVKLVTPQGLEYVSKLSDSFEINADDEDLTISTTYKKMLLEVHNEYVLGWYQGGKKIIVGENKNFGESPKPMIVTKEI